MITQLSGTYLGHALEAAIATTLLILLVLAVRKPVARHFGAGIAYALWLLPFARLILPPLPHQASIFDWLKAAPEPALASPVHAAGDWTPPGLSSAAAEGPGAHLAFEMPHPAAAVPTSSGLDLPPVTELLALAGGIGLAIWAAGALWFAGRSLLAHARFMAILDREATP